MSATASNPSESSPSAGAGSAAAQFTDPMPLLMAIASPVRYRVLKELADGSYPSVLELAGKFGMHPDMMGKHMKVLRDAGAVVRVRPEDTDGRRQHHQIPKEFRVKSETGAALLDFGVCVLRF